MNPLLSAHPGALKQFIAGAVSILIVLATPCGLRAADPGSVRQDQVEIAATINQLMEKITRVAIETLDAEKTLAPLSKDKESVFFFDAKPYTRSELLHCVGRMYGLLKTMSIKMDRVQVKVLGPDAAVWIACGKGKSVSKSGESYEEFLTETWIWQRIEGQWQVTHYHESVASLPNAAKREAIEKVLKRFAAKLQKAPPMAQNIYGTLEDFLSKNPTLVGSAFALNPARGHQASYYAYRDNHGFSRRNTPTSYDYAQADWYVKSVQTGKAEWSEPYYDIDGASIYMVTCSIPVYSKDKELLGVITADLDL